MAIQSEPVPSPAIITYCNETHTMEFYVPYNTLCATFETVLRNSILQRIYMRPHNKQYCFPFQSPMAANFPIITTTTAAVTDNSFDQFFHILRSQHKHMIIISSLLILFFILIFSFSLRKLFQIIQRTTSTESLYNGKDTIWTLSGFYYSFLSLSVY